MAESSAPPRLTPAPKVWIWTLPTVVAFTLPVRFKLFDVRLIRPEVVPMLLGTTILLPVMLIEPGPLAEMAAPTEIELLAVLAANARLVFAGMMMAVAIEIFPVVPLPIVIRLAVIRFNSAWVRPRLVESSAPPRITPAPIVWICTLPAKVAFTVPVKFMELAVKLISPPVVFTLTVATVDLIPIPVLRFPGVLPVIKTDPVPIAEILAFPVN